MSGGRSLAAWLPWAVLAAMHSCAPSAPAFADGRRPADEPTVAVGPTGSAVRDRTAGRVLRLALSEELRALGGVHVSPQRAARYVVHGSVTRLDRWRVPGGLEVRCEVSLLVSDARHGTVHLMLSGRASARGGRDAQRLAQVAVRAAVRGALRPLRQSLRSLQRFTPLRA